MNEIKQALIRIFQSKRIVFWYDVKQEIKSEYDSLTLPDVEKITLDNNPFGVKHRILRQQPTQKFLLYHDGPPPADLDNWLLDVELAHGSFRADQISLWLHELGLSIEFTDIVAPHAEDAPHGKARFAADDQQRRRRPLGYAVASARFCIWGIHWPYPLLVFKPLEYSPRPTPSRFRPYRADRRDWVPWIPQALCGGCPIGCRNRNIRPVRCRG